MSAAAKHHEIAVRYAWNSRQQKFGRGSHKLIARLRMREIESLFLDRYGGQLPDDDAGLDDLEIAAHHIAHLDGNAEQHILAWASVWAPWLWRHEHVDPVKFARRIASKPHRFKADTLAWRLRLTADDRRRLGITTIGAVDCNAQMRATLRQKKKRIAAKARRLAAGALPREQSAGRQKPWLVWGISRSTWFRRGKPMPETNSYPADGSAIMVSTNSSHRTSSAPGEEALQIEVGVKRKADVPSCGHEHPVPAVKPHLAGDWLLNELGQGDPARGKAIASVIGHRRLEFLHQELTGGRLYLSAVRSASSGVREARTVAA